MLEDYPTRIFYIQGSVFGENVQEDRIMIGKPRLLVGFTEVAAPFVQANEYLSPTVWQLLRLSLQKNGI